MDPRDLQRQLQEGGTRDVSQYLWTSSVLTDICKELRELEMKEAK